MEQKEFCMFFRGREKYLMFLYGDIIPKNGMYSSS